MIPVYQTKFGEGEGNCHAAALASILEIQLDQIPDFGSDESWYDNFQRYMISHHALQPFDILVDEDTPIDLFVPQGFHIINGVSPRGIRHSAVGFMGKMEHDPHPDNLGLETVDSFTIFAVLDPKALPKIPPSGMQKGYQFKRVICPECKQSVTDNWLVRHLKSGCRIAVTQNT